MSEKIWLKRYDEGVPQNIDYPDIPLYGLLEEAAKKYPESP
jgi:long-chain acyl-CoA synthetase